MGRQVEARPIASSAVVILLALCVAGWFGLRAGVYQHSPWILAAGVGVLLLAIALRCALLIRDASTGVIGRLRAGTGALVLLGLLLTLGAGLTNWCRRIQGFVVLTQDESVALHQGGQLQEFDHGPFADIDSLDVSMTLIEVNLIAGSQGHFSPESRIVVVQGHGKHEGVTLSPIEAAEAGDLLLYQGAFGFAPTIVILEGDRTVFEETVPFLTERIGPTGISFRGEFTIEREDLAVAGTIDLDTLDTDMRGHSTLRLVVSRNGSVLGEGALLPGKFAEIDEGYRIGFVGLKRWSEIDVSRRNYRNPMFAGIGMSTVGLILWPIGAWWRR